MGNACCRQQDLDKKNELSFEELASQIRRRQALENVRAQVRVTTALNNRGNNLNPGIPLDPSLNNR